MSQRSGCLQNITQVDDVVVEKIAGSRVTYAGTLHYSQTPRACVVFFVTFVCGILLNITSCSKTCAKPSLLLQGVETHPSVRDSRAAEPALIHVDAANGNFLDLETSSANGGGANAHLWSTIPVPIVDNR